MLPIAQTASNGPAADVAPLLSANAMVATSAPPSMAPIANAQTTSGARTPQGMAPAAWWATPAAGGSVCFWLTRTAVPATAAKVAKTSPASGWTTLASVVTSAGPTMKTISSTTASSENAVWRSDWSVRTCDHLARTDAPICGSAAPAAAAQRCGHGAASPRSTQNITPARESANPPTATGRTLL